MNLIYQYISIHPYFHLKFLLPPLRVPIVIVEFLAETTGEGALCLELFCLGRLVKLKLLLVGAEF
jgi:hypothetical protein